MLNPFDYLKRRREQASNDEREKRNKELEIESLREKAVERYRATVVEALELLCEAEYPHTEVKQIQGAWFIGYQMEDGGATFNVRVVLNFDPENHPVSFICRRWVHVEETAGLSKDSLIAALKKLHP